MPTIEIESKYSVGGVVFDGSISRTAVGQTILDIVLDPGVAGVLSDAEDGGVEGLPTGHGFEVDDLVDVHWISPTDGTPKVSAQFTIDVANANDIEFAGSPAPYGDGFPLPYLGLSVVVSRAKEKIIGFSGGGLTMITVQSNVVSSADFRTVSASTVLKRLPAGELWSWASDLGVTNPFGSSIIAMLRTSNGETVAGLLSVAVLFDSEY